MVAETDPPDPAADPVTSSQRRQWQERFSNAWRQVSASIGDGIPSADLSNEVVVLLPLADGDVEPVAGHGVVRRAVTAVAGDKGGGRRPFSVGVSRVASGIEELPTAYAQARRAVDVGRRIRAGGRPRSSTSSACTA